VKVTIQAVRDREHWVNQISHKFKDIQVFYDDERLGNFGKFIEIVNKKWDSYRLHLQDDVLIAKDLDLHLDSLQNEMQLRDIHLLSLFAPSRKFLYEQYKKGIRFSEFPDFLMMQGVIFSPYANEKMIEFNKNIVKRHKHDDVFVREFLKEYKIKSYVHLPSLVQHNLNLKSTLGHSSSIQRRSQLFNFNFYDQGNI
jgi:hypothetical protein